MNLQLSKLPIALLIATLFSSGTSTLPQADDWPQWGGPNRDFKSNATGLAASWPPGGPARVWARELGEGYSAIAAVSGTLYTMYRRHQEEVVIALEAATGRTVWEFAYHAPFRVAGREADEVREYHLERGKGPHATPLVVQNRVFTVGATGKLHCLNRHTGEVIWSHDLIADLEGFVRQRGYASSPIAYRNMVILPVGAVGGSIVAFDQSDGRIVWKKHDFHQAYASLSLISVDGERQLVGFMRDYVVAVSPDDGELFWSHHVKSTQGTNVSTPVWGDGNLLFFSAAYGVGARVLKLTRHGDRTEVREVWANPRVRLHFGNAIRLGDVIYFSSGDFGPSFFTAVDVRTGRIIWRERGFARASFVHADGRFIILDEEGYLLLATPTSTGLTIHATAKILDANSWTAPTLVGTRLYVRDRKAIVALDLS